MSCTSAIFKAMNPFVAGLVRSPLHFLISDHTMVITFKGRKSGRQYSTPVSYFRADQAVYCFTRAPWWRNIGEGAEVSVHIKGREFSGHAQAIPDDTPYKTQTLTQRLRANPKAGRFYGVSFSPAGDPNEEEVLKFTSASVMIVIEIEPTGSPSST